MNQPPAPASSASQGLYWLIPLLLYAAAVLLITGHHEPWRDEADAWMVARDNGLGEIFRLTGYMGTPTLWYLVLWPLPRLGLSYEIGLFINPLIAIVATAILLARAPFPLWMRCLIAFSYFPAYEYAVIARPYALTMLLIFSVASLDERRSQRPVLYGLLIAALANTTTHGLIIAAGWGALLVADALKGESRGAALKAAGVALLGGLLSVVQLLPPDDRQTLVSAPPLSVVPNLFSSLTIPGAGEAWIYEAAVALNVLALAVTLWMLWPRPRAFAYFAGVSTILVGLFLFVYIGGARHAGLITLVAISAAWIGSARAPLPGARVAGTSLAVVLAISVVCTAVWWTRDYQGQFSGAERMARYLIENELAERPIAAYEDGKAMAVLAYLPRRTFWYAGRGREGSHMTWDLEYVRSHQLNMSQAIDRINAAFIDEPDLLILLNQGFRNPEAFGARLVFASDHVIAHPEERFYLYEKLDRGLPVDSFDLVSSRLHVQRRDLSLEDALVGEHRRPPARERVIAARESADEPAPTGGLEDDLEGKRRYAPRHHAETGLLNLTPERARREEVHVRLVEHAARPVFEAADQQGEAIEPERDVGRRYEESPLRLQITSRASQ